MSRFVSPQTTALTLEDGAVLTVKQRLTYGERSDAYEAIARDSEGRAKPSSLAVEMVIAYLVDWTITGDDGAIVPFRGLPHADQVSTLRAMDADAFRELSDAVDAHVTRVQAARESAKKNGGPA